MLGYILDMSKVFGIGYFVGVVYEILDIVLCVFLIYNFVIESIYIYIEFGLIVIGEIVMVFKFWYFEV